MVHDFGSCLTGMEPDVFSSCNPSATSSVLQSHSDLMDIKQNVSQVEMERTVNSSTQYELSLTTAGVLELS